MVKHFEYMLYLAMAEKLFFRWQNTLLGI